MFVVSVSLNATWRVDFPSGKIAFFCSLAYNLQSTLYSYRMLELRTLCSLWGVYTFKAHLHFNWFYRITPFSILKTRIIQTKRKQAIKMNNDLRCELVCKWVSKK